MFQPICSATYYLHMYKRRETVPCSKQAIFSSEYSAQTLRPTFQEDFPQTLFPNVINQLSTSQRRLQNKANGTELPQELKSCWQGNCIRVTMLLNDSFIWCNIFHRIAPIWDNIYLFFFPPKCTYEDTASHTLSS